MKNNEVATEKIDKSQSLTKLIKFFFLLFLIMILVAKTQAQNVFQRSLTGHHTQPVPGGGFYATSGNIYEASLSKMDNNGDAVWTKTYDYGGSNNFSYGMTVTSDTGAALCGSTYNGFNFYPYIIKVNKEGNVNFVKLYGTGAFHDIKKTYEGGLVACGNYYKQGYIVNTDLNGNIIWANTYDTCVLYSIYQCRDSSFIASGMKNYNIFILKTSKTGAVQWAKELNFKGLDNGQCVIEDKDGGFVISGEAGGYLVTYLFNNACLLKVDKKGNLLWSKLLVDHNPGKLKHYATSNYLAVTEDNSYLLLTYTLVDYNGTNNLIKISPSFKVKWAKEYGEGSSSNSNFTGTVFSLPDNTCILSKWNGVSFKVDSMGNSGCNIKPGNFSLLDSLPTIQTHNISASPINIVESTTVNVTNTNHQFPNDLRTIDSLNIIPDGNTSFCVGKNVILRVKSKINIGTLVNYKWNDGSNQNEILADTTKRYTIRATSASNCIRDTFIDIALLPLPPANITAQGTTTFCSGDSVLLSATDGNYSYKWWPGGSVTTKTFSVKRSGTYSVEIKNNITGCQNITQNKDQINVTVKQSPSNIIEVSGPTGFCSGDSVSLTADTSCTYLWSNGKTNRTITIYNTGNYSAVVKGINGCETKSDTIAVKSVSNASAKVSISAENDTACASVQLKFTASPMFEGDAPTYEWRVNKISKGIGFKNAQFDLNDGDVVDCILTSDLACASINKDTSNSIAIKVIDKPSTPGSITGDLNLCDKTIKDYSIKRVSGAESYIWEVPDGSSIESVQGDTLIRLKVGKTSGQLRVSAKNICGTSTAQFINLSINTPPTNPTGITGLDTVCENSFAKFYSVQSVSNADNYIWTIPNGATIDNGTGTGTIVLTYGTTSGAITVKAANSCGTTTTFTKNIVVLNPPAINTNIIGLSTVCKNTNNLQYSISKIDGATTYNWEVVGGGSVSSDNGKDTVKISFLSGSAIVKVKASNACGSSLYQTKDIAIISPPSAPQDVTGIKSLCESSTGYLKTSSIDTKTFSWILPSGYSIVSGQGNDSLVFKSGNSKDTILVYALNACGSSISFRVPIAVKKLPKATGFLNGITEACENSEQQYSMNFTDASSFKWIIPASMKIIGGENSGTLNLNIGKQNGKIAIVASNSCGNSDTIKANITINPKPAKPTISTSITTGLTSSDAASYQWIMNGSNITGQTNKTYMFTDKGFYQVRITDSKGCSNISDSVEILKLDDAISSITNNGFNFYPNPVKNVMNIEFNDEIPSEILIIRTNGEVVKKINITRANKQQIDLSSLKSGSYIIYLKTENHNSKKLFIKM